jgi:hypothetical protein
MRLRPSGLRRRFFFGADLAAGADVFDGVAAPASNARACCNNATSSLNFVVRASLLLRVPGWPRFLDDKLPKPRNTKEKRLTGVTNLVYFGQTRGRGNHRVDLLANSAEEGSYSGVTNELPPNASSAPSASGAGCRRVRRHRSHRAERVAGRQERLGRREDWRRDSCAGRAESRPSRGRSCRQGGSGRR